MMFARKFLVLSVLAAFGLAPTMRALASDTGGFSRTPADASTSAKAKKKKKKKKAKKKSSKKKKKTSKHARSSRSSSRPKSHAPQTPVPEAPKYPTQPNSGAYNDVPNEKKDDLPAPQTPPND